MVSKDKGKQAHEKKAHGHASSKVESHKGHDTKSHGHKTQGVAAKNVTREEAEFIAEHADGLSKTTQRAKWIHSPDEHEDKPGQSLATRSHDVIKHWAEERSAKPATVPGTEHEEHAGVLRFNFPNYGGRELEEVDWDAWFESFDDRDLVFIYQEHKSDGAQSNFFKLDNPNRERS